MGDLTLLELSKYDGRDPLRPLLLAVRGRVFDVTPGRAFYGPGALLNGGLPLCCASPCAARLAAAPSADMLNCLLALLQAQGTTCLRARRWRAPWPRWRWTRRSAATSAPEWGRVCGVAGGGGGGSLGGPVLSAAVPSECRHGSRLAPTGRILAPAFVSRLDDLSAAELESLADWERTFEGKYEVVGKVRGRTQKTGSFLAGGGRLSHACMPAHRLHRLHRCLPAAPPAPGMLVPHNNQTNFNMPSRRPRWREPAAAGLTSQLDAEGPRLHLAPCIFVLRCCPTRLGPPVFLPTPPLPPRSPCRLCRRCGCRRPSWRATTAASPASRCTFPSAAPCWT